jgi:dihydroorotase
MKLLLKQVTISDTQSSHFGTVQDILVVDGIIQTIGASITDDGASIITGHDVRVSSGWVDVFAHFNDPGLEYNETLDTGSEAAAAGGYTHVFVLPNTSPVVASNSTIQYIVQKAKNLIVDILPIGAVSKNAEGKELAEMYDMRNSGAVAFSDGVAPVQTAGLLLKALQYVKAFDGTIIQLPVDRSVGKTGLMNESITSTRLGLPGLPAIAEELMINRDIELAAYTGSRLHITGVSTAKGLQAIQSAKAAGLNVTCSVTPYHLYYCDEDLVTYDTNLKVDPPLRSRDDMMQLRAAVKDGSVDCIASHHLPNDWDHKTCEFEYAKPGMIGLQTAFNVVTNVCDLDDKQIARLFSINARRIFNLPANTIELGNKADMTIYTHDGNFTFARSLNKSKSNNSAFFGKSFRGRVVGIINKDQLYLNP